jgi:hypothetical protein
LAPLIADGADKSVGEVGDVPIQEQNVHPDIEDGCDAASLEANRVRESALYHFQRC